MTKARDSGIMPVLIAVNPIVRYRLMAELKWVPAFTVEHETLVASINRAELGSGNVLHSIRISRKAPNGMKPSQFLRTDDMTYLADLGIKVSARILKDISELRHTAVV